jgi:hypothetical protein
MMTSHTDDPLGVFQPTQAAVDAGARKLLRQRHVYEPSLQQLEDARESYRLEYQAQAEYVLRKGKVA